MDRAGQAGRGARGPGRRDWSNEWDEQDGFRVLQQVPPSLPEAAPRQRARGEQRGSIYSTTAAPSRGGPSQGPHEAAFTRTSSPPRLIVPGPSSFPPITCFMSDPSLGCLLSEKSVAPTKCQLSASLCRSLGALPPCLPTTAQEGGEGARQRKRQQAGEPGAGTRRPACGKHLPAGAAAKKQLVPQCEQGLDPPAVLPQSCPRHFAPWGHHPGTAAVRQSPALRLPCHRTGSLLCPLYCWSDPPSFSHGSRHVPPQQGRGFGGAFGRSSPPQAAGSPGWIPPRSLWPPVTSAAMMGWNGWDRG